MSTLKLTAKRTLNIGEYVYCLKNHNPEDLQLNVITSSQFNFNDDITSLKYDPIVTIIVETNIKAPNIKQKVFNHLTAPCTGKPSPFMQSNTVSLNGFFTLDGCDNICLSISAKRFFVAENSARKKETIEKINQEKNTKAEEFGRLDGVFFKNKENGLKKIILTNLKEILQNHRQKCVNSGILEMPDFISEQLDVMKNEVFEEVPQLKEKVGAIEMIDSQIKMLQRQKSEMLSDINSACIDMLYDSIGFTSEDSISLEPTLKNKFHDAMSSIDYGKDIKEQLTA